AQPSHGFPPQQAQEPVMTPLSLQNLPLFIEVFADATGVGKSFAAWRLRYHLDLAGIANVMVRIETLGVQAPLRKGDVYVAVEEFTQASQRPGGIAGVLQPLAAKILALRNTRSAVIVDWGGGLARHHLEYLAKTHLDALLAKYGITGLSLVATTSLTEPMRQAAANLRDLATVAPRLLRGLLL